MANIKSSKKDIRKTRTRTERNRRVKSELKTLLKKFRDAREGEDAAVTQQAARDLVSALDKAAKRKIVHPNLARRHKINCTPYV
ncbi:MAG: 30S ribosomal protein S20 [Puniceicoccaceae bacterium]